MSSAKKIIISLVLLLAGCLVYFGGSSYFSFQKVGLPDSTNNKKQPTVPVVAQKAHLGTLPVYARSIGTVVSPHSVEIRPQVDGTLVELLVKEGSFVEKDSLLARIDDREIRATIRQEKAELANRQAQLNIATTDVKRYKQLKAQNAIPGQSLDQQQALVNQLQAQIAGQKATIEAHEILLSYTQIKAPISGVVGIVNVHEGNFIRASDAQRLFSIMQVNPVSVEIGLPQALLPQLLPLMAQDRLSEIRVLAYAQDEQTLLATGQLAVLDNQVSAQTGTLKARATFENNEHALWPGQTVIAKLQMKELDAVVIVPNKAVLQGNRMTYVWRIDDGVAKMVKVSVLHSDEEQSAVTGLKEGDEVVVDGASRLREGSPVEKLTPQIQMPQQDARPEEQV